MRDDFSHKKISLLVIAQGHPIYSGRARDRIAYDHFLDLRRSGSIEPIFLSSTSGRILPPLGAPLFQPASGDEYLLSVPDPTPPFLSNLAAQIRAALIALSARLNPDIVHLHDVDILGVEIIHWLRMTFPGAKIIAGLSDFAVICHNNGIMTKIISREFCDRGGPVVCQVCYPKVGQGDFLLRSLYHIRFLNTLDAVIVRSEYMRLRYVDFGIEESLLKVWRPSRNGEPTVMPPGCDALLLYGELTTGGSELIQQATAILEQSSGLPRAIRIDARLTLAHPAGFDPSLSATNPGQARTVYLRDVTAAPITSQDDKWSSYHAVIAAGDWDGNAGVIVSKAALSGRPLVCGIEWARREGLLQSGGVFLYEDKDAASLASKLQEICFDLTEVEKKGRELYTEEGARTSDAFSFYTALIDEQPV